MQECREFSFKLFLLVAFNLFIQINGFNISPKPNMVFKEPSLKVYKPKVRSSYFGFTLNLREQRYVLGSFIFYVHRTNAIIFFYGKIPRDRLFCAGLANGGVKYY